jgi:hypothetical protein
MIFFEGHHKFGHDHFRTEIWDIDDLGRDLGGRQVPVSPKNLKDPLVMKMGQWKNNYRIIIL